MTLLHIVEATRKFSTMSRDPAPMSRSNTTTSAAGCDPNNTKPYGPATYSMIPPTSQSAMASNTPSPISSMQNMYTQSVLERQRQYQRKQQMQSGQQFGPGSPNTMQNVSVVDFKPNIMAQHGMEQMRQNYQNQMGMTVAEPPSLGLVGPDGTWNAATAADPYSSNDAMFNHHTTGATPQRHCIHHASARNRMRSSLPLRRSVSSDHHPANTGRRSLPMYRQKVSSDYTPNRYSRGVTSEYTPDQCSRGVSSEYSNNRYPRHDVSSEYMPHEHPRNISSEYKSERYPPMHVGADASYHNENYARMNQRHTDARTISQMIDARVDARALINDERQARADARVEARVEAGP